MRGPAAVGWSVERWEHAASHDVAHQKVLLDEGLVALRQASQAWRAQLRDSSQSFQGERDEPPEAEGFDFSTAAALSAALLLGCVAILIMRVAHKLRELKDVAHKLPGRKDFGRSVHPVPSAHIDHVIQSTPSTGNVIPDEVEVLSKVAPPLPLKVAESRSFSQSLPTISAKRCNKRSISRSLPTISEGVEPEGTSTAVHVARLCVEIQRSASANGAADEPLMRAVQISSEDDVQISSEDEGQAEHERRSPHTGPTHTGPVAHTAAQQPSELSRMSSAMGSHAAAEPQKPAITRADALTLARRHVLDPQRMWLGRLEESSHTMSLHESDENDPLALYCAIQRVLPPQALEHDVLSHSSMMELSAYNERMQRNAAGREDVTSSFEKPLQLSCFERSHQTPAAELHPPLVDEGEFVPEEEEEGPATQGDALMAAKRRMARGKSSPSIAGS